MNDGAIEQKLDAEFNAKVQALTGLMPNNEILDNDVIIDGYMKSGSTWFRNLVAGVIYGIDPELVPYKLVWDLVPNYGPKRPYYKRYSLPMYFKSHDLPQPQFKRVVYLIRDGRDVMVSYFHHFKTMEGGKESDFLKLVKGKKGLPAVCKWHRHVETWLSNPYQAQLLMIKYEDLKNNPVNELRRFCAFAGADRDEAFLQRIADKASFENMRQKEAEKGMGLLAWPKEKAFVRRGQIGSYKDEMPPEILEVFLRDAEDTLRKLGYL